MKILNKKVLVAASLIICTIIASFAALNFIAFAQPYPVTVYVDPPETTVNVCDEFVINVNVKGVQSDYPVYDYDFFLFYDSSVMKPTGAVDGGFLMSPVIFNWEILADSVHVWAVTMDGGASGSGTLARITFHCEAPGHSTLSLEVWLSDAAGNVYPPEIYQITTLGGTVDQEYRPAYTYIEPPTYTVPICVPFTVNVKVNDVTNLHSFGLVLTYTNTPVVDAVDIVPGNFLPLPMVTHKLINDAAGRIEFNVTAGVAWGTSGSGTLATITFHCTGAGESILTLDTVDYWDPNGNPIPTVTSGGRVIQIAYWEPIKLIDIVEWPGVVAYWDIIPFPWPPGTPPGYMEIMAELEAKGYVFDDPTMGTAMHVEGSIEEESFSGTVTSLWSSNTLEDGTRACMLSAEMDDGTSMAMAFVTNLLPPEQVPEVDPYIIVNAQPYLFVRFYWYAWPSDIYPVGRIITWSYWWYDSHSHPNWFWGPYWWWRTYTKAYFLGMPWPAIDINWVYWRPWWGWWWHWVYWRHWYWWSTYFPYDP